MDEEHLLICYQDRQGRLVSRGIYLTRMTEVLYDDQAALMQPHIFEAVSQGVSSATFFVSHHGSMLADPTAVYPVDISDIIDTGNTIWKIVGKAEQSESTTAELFYFILDILDTDRAKQIHQHYGKQEDPDV